MRLCENNSLKQKIAILSSWQIKEPNLAFLQQFSAHGTDLTSDISAKYPPGSHLAPVFGVEFREVCQIVSK